MKKLIHSIAVLTVLFLASFTPVLANKGDGKYPFVVPAPKAIETIATLEKVSGKKITLHADEKKLLTEAATGKLQSFSFADAALIASGAADPTARKKYLAQLDVIEKDARKAIEGCDSAADKGKKLLKFLHDGPMSKGYSTEQTDLSIVLKEGQFNCVSSAVLYNVIASRLGLEVQAMEIAGGAFGTGHVFSVLKDGDRLVPVETTNAKGFGIQDNMKKKNKRAIGELGLIAVIYYNHGVSLARENRRHEALLANLCALSLDKNNPSAANNAMADLINWERDLSGAGKYSDGLEVIRVGLTLAPKDAKLLQNRKVVVQDIVMKEVEAGNYTGAWGKVNELKDVLNDKEHTRRLILMVVDTEAQKHVSNKEWDSAVKVYSEALKKLPGDSHLKNNLVATYDSWARTHMDTSDWDGAIRVYRQGLTTLPGNGLFTNNIRYCQEQLKKR